MRLVLVLPDGTRSEVPLLPCTTLGRGPANTVLLPDRQVSKEHGRIERHGEGWVYRDLGSSNGSFVNGVRTELALLREGDELALGSCRLSLVSSGATRSRAGVTVYRSPAEAASILKALSREEAAGFLPEGRIEDPAQLRRDYQKLRVAAELARQIALERDEEALIERILAFAFEVLPAERGAILLLDPATGELEPRASRRRDGGQAEVAISESVLRRVQSTRESVLILDAGSDLRFTRAQSLVAEGIRSAMAVPLLVEEAVRGVLFVDSSRQAAAFSEKDLLLLSGIAAQAALALERTALLRRIEQEAEARAHLSRFLSPALVEQARSGALDLRKGGQLLPTTVLFSDIRGFTSISERVGPEETVRMLGEYFERMVDCVFRHGGVLDKFIGDAVMAIWGAPVGRADDVDRALACAREMLAELESLNASWGREPIAIGIGVNAGPAVVGNIGSSKRLEYTAIGDTVNLASRLCGLAGAGEIVLSEGALALASGRVEAEELPAQTVKGKAAPVKLYRLIN